MLQRLSSAPAPPQGAPGGSGQLGSSQEEAGPLGAQPLPRVLELAASEATDFTVPACDHAGVKQKEKIKGSDPSPSPNPNPNPNHQP